VSAPTRFRSDQFPRASKYHPDWIAASVSGGANALRVTEWLTAAIKKIGTSTADLPAPIAP
jgi:hypothetical protein